MKKRDEGHVWGERRWPQPHLPPYEEGKAFPGTSQETSAYAALARTGSQGHP